jgi:hypothetical protein
VSRGGRILGGADKFMQNSCEIHAKFMRKFMSLYWAHSISRKFMQNSCGIHAKFMPEFMSLCWTLGKSEKIMQHSCRFQCPVRTAYRVGAV